MDGAPKGVVVGARVTRDLARQIQQHAAARNQTTSSYVAALLAAAVGGTER